MVLRDMKWQTNGKNCQKFSETDKKEKKNHFNIELQTGILVYKCLCETKQKVFFFYLFDNEALFRTKCEQ